MAESVGLDSVETSGNQCPAQRIYDRMAESVSVESVGLDLVETSGNQCPAQWVYDRMAESVGLESRTEGLRCIPYGGFTVLPVLEYSGFTTVQDASVDP